MPELPEVEAVCRRLRDNLAAVADQRIVDARILRPSVTRPQQPDFVTRESTGHAIRDVRRKGKHIFLDLDNRTSLHVHLRMTGNLRWISNVQLHMAATRAWFAFADGSGIAFDDPRALGKIQLVDESFDPGVGPEPHELALTDFKALAAGHRGPVKLLLMDQARIAGLGNIYAAEALFQARVHPAKPSNQVSPVKLRKLHEAMVSTLEIAKDSAYRAYTEPGYFAEGEHFPIAVYDREGEPCFTCARKIQRIAQGGRSTYFCPGCQK